MQIYCFFLLSSKYRRKIYLVSVKRFTFSRFQNSKNSHFQKFLPFLHQIIIIQLIFDDEDFEEKEEKEAVIERDKGLDKANSLGHYSDTIY